MFGRFSPEKLLVDADPRGTHVIFVDANQVQHLLKQEGPFKGTINSTTEFTRWLINCRLSGGQDATKAIYKAHGMKTFGISKGQFQGCWEKAAREVPNPKGRWGKSGPRTSSEEIK